MNDNLNIKLIDENKKKFIPSLIIFFILLSICMVVYESVLYFRYEQWRSDYEKNGDWYDGLTTISENPELMWEYRPNAENKYMNLRTNRYGFRDFDYETPYKQADVYRIAFIGDSITFGLNVHSQCTFVRKFERYANESHSDSKIQSMNFGIDGYNTSQIFELLSSKVLLFKPDKVVYVMCLNDFDFEDSSGEKIRFFKKPNSFVLKRLENLYRDSLNIDFHLWHFEKNKQQVYDKIVEMKQLLLEQNIDFQIVLVPVFGFEGSNINFTGYPLSRMHVEIMRFMKKEKIDEVDLLDAFKNQEKPPDYFACDAWHPNHEGHEFITIQLLKNLL